MKYTQCKQRHHKAVPSGQTHEKQPSSTTLSSANQLSPKWTRKQFPCTLQHIPLYINDYFSAWSTFLVFSNAHLFHSFHMIQDGHKGATLQAVFLLLPTKDPCQLRRAFFNWGVHYLLDPKHSKNQWQQDYPFWAMKGNMIHCFVSLFAHITSMQHHNPLLPLG